MVFIFTGRDDANQQDTVYIGQSNETERIGEGVLLRVQEHTRDNHADYFNDVIVLTTQIIPSGRLKSVIWKTDLLS